MAVLTGAICFPIAGAVTGATADVFFRAAAEQIKEKRGEWKRKEERMKEKEGTVVSHED